VQSKGVSIGLRDYAAWVKRWGHLIGHVANLDVIKDPEATLRNQKALEVLGVQPVPVFHAGSPWEYLERYVEEYPYVALGGTVRSPADFRPWLVRCFRIGEGKTVFHGFGTTRWPLLRDFPFYSVDSSSWMQGYRYGSMRLFDRGRWVLVKMRSRHVWEHADLLKKHGIRPQDVASREGYTWEHPFKAGMVTWLRAAEWLRQRHGEIPLAGHESGPIIYLAADGSGHNPRRMRISGEVARAVA
jgi:hypothetical protein